MNRVGRAQAYGRVGGDLEDVVHKPETDTWLFVDCVFAPWLAE